MVACPAPDTDAAVSCSGQRQQAGASLMRLFLNRNEQIRSELEKEEQEEATGGACSSMTWDRVPASAASSHHSLLAARRWIDGSEDMLLASLDGEVHGPPSSIFSTTGAGADVKQQQYEHPRPLGLAAGPASLAPTCDSNFFGSFLIIVDCSLTPLSYVLD